MATGRRRQLIGGDKGVLERAEDRQQVVQPGRRDRPLRGFTGHDTYFRAVPLLLVGIDQDRESGRGEERHRRQVDDQDGRTVLHRCGHRVGQLARGQQVHLAADGEHKRAVDVPAGQRQRGGGLDRTATDLRLGERRPHIIPEEQQRTNASGPEYLEYDYVADVTAGQAASYGAAGHRLISAS
ncbi:hypothetical protein QP939_11270 [Amycolatopsis nalaikhensis]|uniref:Uncharacterized protein n=1 Tax=Amycolatopsis nalaikhensis TaxID=715472 RepID=A0ABY8XU86_9PSEU|nr:hypothetical protein [Amycolatopsis sp. 2-2]WIV59158.1 hypothetical protein QP939_11270 [Amycolatopsis sp. 2-2]